MLDAVSFTPIGVVKSPFVDKVSAPRQAVAAADVRGTIELFPGRDFEHALSDLEGWDRLWVIFCFHLNEPGGWRPKVLPPRSTTKRGVFATRSPHRPNPIGMSVVRLESIDGLVLHVRDLDIVDGSPVLDIKPYVPYADAFPDARTGWLEPLAAAPGEAAPPRDPVPAFTVVWSVEAAAQAAWLRERGVDLAEPVNRVLGLGPQPHPYRRIKREGAGFRLAVKDWRVRFRVDGRTVTVDAIGTGYRPAELATSSAPEVAIQREFVAHFAALVGSRDPS